MLVVFVVGMSFVRIRGQVGESSEGQTVKAAILGCEMCILRC